MPTSQLAPSLTHIRGSVTLNPGSIETFAALCHILFAHIYNPHPIGDSEHHKAAREYIMAHQREAAVDLLAADAASATYSVGYRGRVPLTIRVLIGKPIADSFQMLSGTGAWVQMDMTAFALVTPPRG